MTHLCYDTRSGGYDIQSESVYKVSIRRSSDSETGLQAQKHRGIHEKTQGLRVL